MDKCINELEDYLLKLDQLNNHANYLLDQLKKAESAGQLDKCRICSKQWAVTRKAASFLVNQIDNHIMFRLPPVPNHLNNSFN